MFSICYDLDFSLLHSVSALKITGHLKISKFKSTYLRNIFRNLIFLPSHIFRQHLLLIRAHLALELLQNLLGMLHDLILEEGSHLHLVGRVDGLCGLRISQYFDAGLCELVHVREALLRLRRHQLDRELDDGQVLRLVSLEGNRRE